jgi:hypothetical protein
LISTATHWIAVDADTRLAFRVVAEDATPSAVVRRKNP